MAVFVLGAIGAIILFHLYFKVNDLERKVAELKIKQSAPAVQAAPTVSTGPTSFASEVTTAHSTSAVRQVAMPNHSVVLPPAPPPLAPDASSPFIDWLQQDMFAKLGALLLLIAFGWFVSYAFANNWIGPAGRIAIGLLVGTGILALGVWRMQRFVTQGALFLLLGSTTVILTTFAARSLYDFFTPAIALLVMTAAIVFVAYNAVVYRQNSLAVASVILGGIAPLLIADSEPNTILLLTYLLVLVLGSMWILLYTHATALLFTSFAIVVAYTVPYMSDSTALINNDIPLLFGFAFGMVFMLCNCASMVLRASSNENSIIHVLVGVGTGLYVLAWISSSIATEWQVIWYLIWGMLYAGIAFLVFIRTNAPLLFYVHGSVGLGFLAAATAALFSGPVLTLAFTIEVGVLVLIAQKITRNTAITHMLCWLFAVPVLLSLESMVSPAWRDGVLHSDFFILSILMLVMSIVATVLLGVSQQQPEDETESTTPMVLVVVSSFYAVLLVWLMANALLSSEAAIFTALFIYTVTGLGLYFHGLSTHSHAFKVAGAILIALVMARLLIVDVWQMELTGRIITFAVIGIMLMSTAFIGKFNKS